MTIAKSISVTVRTVFSFKEYDYWVKWQGVIGKIKPSVVNRGRVIMLALNDIKACEAVYWNPNFLDKQTGCRGCWVQLPSPSEDDPVKGMTCHTLITLGNRCVIVQENPDEVSKLIENCR